MRRAGYVHGIAHKPDTSATELLALLALLNTNTEDWWARRFVDRHVTAPVVNNLPLPNLDLQDLQGLAERAAVILVRNGYSRLGGDIDVAAIARDSKHAQDSLEQLLGQSEAVVARGFGLTAEDIDLIRSDFSEKGMPHAVFTVAIDHLTAVNSSASETL